MDEAVSKYEASLKFLAMLGTEAGDEIRKTNPELVQKAYRMVEKYQTEYMASSLELNEEAMKKMNDIAELEDALQYFPPTEYKAIGEFKADLEKTSKELQSDLLYQPKTFFDQYFLTSQSKHNELVFGSENNERFKMWFAGSKVVDANGKPLVCYHGTPLKGGKQFSRFDMSNFPATYFAEKRSYSEWFARSRGGEGIVLECYLRVQNPIDFTELQIDKLKYNEFVDYVEVKYGYKLPDCPMLREHSEQSNGLWGWQYIRYGVDWLKIFKENKEFDGFHYVENNPDDKDADGKQNITTAWMVFDGNQMKVADMRNVTYSLFDDNMNRKKGGKI